MPDDDTDDDSMFRRTRVLDDLPKHPTQPLVIDEHGVVRFRANKIVRFLLDTSKNNLNDLHAMPFSDDDHEQLCMLIGYSASSFGDLSFVDPERVAEADRHAAEVLRAWQARKNAP